MDYMNILKNNKKLIGLCTGIIIILTIILTLVQTFEYRASVGLMIIQKYNQSLDPYSIAKSSEILKKNLGSIIHTSSFFDKIMNSGFALENNFSSDQIKRKKQWRKKISINPSLENAMLVIDAYDKNKEQAKEFTNAIAYVLATQGHEYYGGDKNIEIKLVDYPVVSRFPVRPNILLNLLFGLILGLGAGIGMTVAYNAQRITHNVERITQNHVSQNIEHETRGMERTTVAKEAWQADNRVDKTIDSRRQIINKPGMRAIPNNIPFVDLETNKEKQIADNRQQIIKQTTDNRQQKIGNSTENMRNVAEPQEFYGSMDNLYK
ncbi:hypothetical protein KKH19_01040 [Patescibacteria group bacterium]|nr:hypothetical protein [Patescibacteria group bacterium]MBU2456668.1 hypothetical protein [Patescibacteria group bacterium]